MHELTIARAIIEAAGTEATRRGAMAVRRINCQIGVLRQAEEWLLQEAFQAARERTPCARAELVVEQVEMTAWCRTCCRRFPVLKGCWRCPRCGTDGENLAGGDELRLTSLEIELDDAEMTEVDGQTESFEKTGAAT